MKNGFFICVVLMLGLMSVQQKAVANLEANQLRQHLLKIAAQNGLKKESLGIWVASANEQNANLVAEWNSHKKFIPASLTKVLTAAAVFHQVDPNHKFITQLIAAQKPVNGIIKGPLYLVGGGDPSFVSENMWFLVNEFIRNKITSIEGDLVVDDSRFGNERISAGRSSKRVDRAYDAPIGAMSFNWNAVNVFVRPGDSVGSAAQVFADPNNDYVLVQNRARTVKAGQKTSISVSRESNGKKGAEQRDVVVVTGNIPLGSEEKVVYKSITDPGLWSGHNLKEFLLQRGIKLSGTVKLGKAPDKASVLAANKSKPLWQVVADMSKFSNNYVAEMLTCELGFQGGAADGNMEVGIEQIGKYLMGLGIAENDFYLTSPSGLSRRNQITPEALGKALLAIRKEFKYFPEFVSALPISGVDGTLKSRMNGNSIAQGLVRAKTGLLDGVSGLAGYIGRPSGEILTFVFIFNGDSKGTYAARVAFDRLAEALIQQDKLASL